MGTEWSLLLQELEDRNKQAEVGGGAERMAKHKAQGKLSARERLAYLFDGGQFQELSRFAQSRPSSLQGNYPAQTGDGVVTAVGKIDGRSVCAFAHDVTVYGGTVGRTGAMKMKDLLGLAERMGAPVIALNDSGGARIQEGIDSVAGYMDYGNAVSRLSGFVPQLSVNFGACAGGPAYTAAMTDSIFMVKEASTMFVTGPEVIHAVTGEKTTKEELGGSKVHSESTGLCQRETETEAEALSLVRKMLTYLPSSCRESAPHQKWEGPVGESSTVQSLIPSDPRKGYDVVKVLDAVLDPGSFFELAPRHARSVVTGLGRMGGYVCGVVANQPKWAAGMLDIQSSNKIARFVRFCDSYNIPVVTFVDTPGFVSGVRHESAGILAHGSHLIHAYNEITVPKLTVALRKAYGGAYACMGSKQCGAQLYLALPTAELAVMGPLGAARILLRQEDATEESLSEEFLRDYRTKFASPYNAAAMGHVDEVIRPEQVRPKLVEAMGLAIANETLPTSRKHMNYFF